MTDADRVCDCANGMCVYLGRDRERARASTNAIIGALLWNEAALHSHSEVAGVVLEIVLAAMSACDWRDRLACCKMERI